MKSRNLSPSEFLEVLQVEYLQAEFRRSIHHSPKQKKYWGKVMVGKKLKILDICSKGQLQNIFNESFLLQEFRDLVYPNLKSNYFKFPLSAEEVDLYYSEGAEVRVEVSLDVWRPGKMMSVNLEKSTALVLVKGSKTPKNYMFSKIIRVL